MRQIGRGLAAFGLELDRIITSPLPRARRTAEIVAAKLGMSARLETSKVLGADSDARTIRSWLRERTESRLMIVGHNPALSDLVGLLVLGEPGRLPIVLKKGGMAALSSSALSGQRYNLDWFAPPGMLRRLGGDS
jgi:phosphohistidine phosphatase